MHRFLFSWGYGARQCAGKDLALMMTFKVCAQVSRNFVLGVGEWYYSQVIIMKLICVMV